MAAAIIGARASAKSELATVSLLIVSVPVTVAGMAMVTGVISTLVV